MVEEGRIAVEKADPILTLREWDSSVGKRSGLAKTKTEVRHLKKGLGTFVQRGGKCLRFKGNTGVQGGEGSLKSAQDTGLG